MNILELATKRKTARKFKPTPIKDEDIEYILETARQAPSGSNRQPWRFIIVRSHEMKKKIREASEAGEKEFYENLSPERKVWYKEKGLSPSKPNLTEAPILIVVVGDTSAPNYKPSLWVTITYMTLAIEELGLATVTYTPSNPVLVSDVIDVPDGFMVESVLPIGFSDDSKTKEPRLEVSELVFRERWGNQS
ncbi:MAG: nitroreductase family protein [Candidatus Bathyarchaeota archaeon]|nr:nitroreductase family protein [Candidatus Bathyarchaeota archaeon]